MRWLFKKVPGFLADSHLSLVDRIPTDFHSQMLCGHFLAVVLWAGEPTVGLRFHVPQGGLWQLRYLSRFSTTHKGVGAALFAPLSFLPVSMWLILQILAYKTSVQLVCTWIFRLIVL